MIERLAYLWPEIAAFLATCVVMVVGLSPRLETRKLCAPVAVLGLLIAWVLADRTTPVNPSPEAGQVLLPHMVGYAKGVICGVGILLVLLAGGAVDRDEERAIATGRMKFDALRTNRAEFYAFFLFSITGLLLVTSASDLIWLFLALELTSLPTYIMVTISGWSVHAEDRSKEAGVKYFFLGALGAATFLYGFTLLYGGTGSTHLNEIAAVLREQFASGGMNPIALLGILLSIVGLCFKIAAFPMHFYTPDVYEGAATPVSAMLAFVPKTAGFIALLLILAAVGWDHGASGGSLPDVVRVMLWVIAALTMSIGNVLALLQSSAKRILAYSSIAHSGYMLVGVIVGPGATFARSGVSAVLFYLLVYGVMTTGAFAVLASLERRRPDGKRAEVNDVDDLRGLWRTHPWMATCFGVCCLSLLGLPPVLGFFGKLPLFTSAISAGEYALVIVLAFNSAIAAFYYLRLVYVAWLASPLDDAGEIVGTPFGARGVVATLCTLGVVLLALRAGPLMERSAEAGTVGTTAGTSPSDTKAGAHASRE